MGKIVSGKKIIFTGEKETFILRAIIEKVQAVGIECAFVPFTVDALNLPSEDISLYILYMDEEVNPREDALHFLIDTMEEKGSKLILIGEQIDLNNLCKHISEDLLYMTFSRPINNDEFVKAIKEFFDKSESGEYRKSILKFLISAVVNSFHQRECVIDQIIHMPVLIYDGVSKGFQHFFLR